MTANTSSYSHYWQLHTYTCLFGKSGTRLSLTLRVCHTFSCVTYIYYVNKPSCQVIPQNMATAGLSFGILRIVRGFMFIGKCRDDAPIRQCCLVHLHPLLHKFKMLACHPWLVDFPVCSTVAIQLSLDLFAGASWLWNAFVGYTVHVHGMVHDTVLYTRDRFIEGSYMYVSGIDCWCWNRKLVIPQKLIRMHTLEVNENILPMWESKWSDGPHLQRGVQEMTHDIETVATIQQNQATVDNVLPSWRDNQKSVFHATASL